MPVFITMWTVLRVQPFNSMTSRRFIVQLLIVVIVLFDAGYLHAEETEKTSDDKGDEAGDDEAGEQWLPKALHGIRLS